MAVPKLSTLSSFVLTVLTLCPQAIICCPHIRDDSRSRMNLFLNDLKEFFRCSVRRRDNKKLGGIPPNIHWPSMTLPLLCLPFPTFASSISTISPSPPIWVEFSSIQNCVTSVEREPVHYSFACNSWVSFWPNPTSLGIHQICRLSIGVLGRSYPAVPLCQQMPTNSRPLLRVWSQLLRRPIYIQ